MKLAEVVAKWLEEKTSHVFGVNGGANLHLLHGIHDVTKIKIIPTAHEQGAGYAADAYARIHGFGVATATSGPGATNLTTAISASYQDSVPVLYLVGNVASFRKGRPMGVRAYGFQELEFVEMVKGITKHAIQIQNPEDILKELDFAYHMATEGRKGPVVVDIPDDFQRFDVNPVKRFTPHPAFPPDFPEVADIWKALSRATRPLCIWGSGVRPYYKEAKSLCAEFYMPVVKTWAVADLLPSDTHLIRDSWRFDAGTFGTHGIKSANFAVQNADFILSLGCRLDTKATGNVKDFAPHAKIAMVDIDRAEVDKFIHLGRKIDHPCISDVGKFLRAMELERPGGEDDGVVQAFQVGKWLNRIGEWKHKYAPVDKPEWDGRPYALMKELSAFTKPTDTIVSDTGNTLGWIMQGFPFKGERFIHATNITPMGYGLGAAIGAAADGRRVIVVVGDGGALMSCNELATIARHNLDVKIILLDNQGHAMCRYTEMQWFNGKHCTTDEESGLGFPEWNLLASSFGIGIAESLGGLDVPGPMFFKVDIDREAHLVNQVRFGRPIEDGEPTLSKEQMELEMA